MAVSNKIKALIKLKGKDNVELAKHLKISKQALSNKLYRGSFSATDLIKISACLGCELAFIVDEKQRITLNEKDIQGDDDGFAPHIPNAETREAMAELRAGKGEKVTINQIMEELNAGN